MKKAVLFLLCLTVLFAPLSGCYTMNNTIGSGAPDGAPVAEDRQWFLLWGLLPLNNVDGGQMAQAKGLRTNYTIQTQQSFIDVILNIFTGFVSVYSRDVKVLAGGSSGTPALSGGGTNYIALGNQSMMAKDYNGAVQNYQNAVNANPSSAGAYQGLGTAYYYLGQKDQSLNAFEQALQLDPNNARLSAFVNKLKNGN
jgi:tetratricopeptide repeat protein/Bor protein